MGRNLVLGGGKNKKRKEKKKKKKVVVMVQLVAREAFLGRP